jgi:lysozyme
MRLPILALRLSAAALVGIAGWEGYKSVAYIPVPGDVPTIGFGTTKGVKMGDTIDPVTALQKKIRDVEIFEGAVKQCVNVPLAQHEYDAYLSLAYNIGPSAFCRSTLVRKLNAGDYAGACKEIEKWIYFKGKPLAGLINRRAQERAMCEGRV